MKPSISIVMPLYNKEREVSRAIRSVLAQYFQDFELVVVNDGSTDNGVDLVGTFSDPRIRLVHQKNQGVSAARNRGVAEACAEIVAFLDADDEWMPEFLSTVLHLADRYPAAQTFATSYLMRTPSGKTREAILNGLKADFCEGLLTDYFALAARSDPPIWSSATAVRKSALLAVGGFPVGIRCGEDLMTWARLASKWPVAYSRKALAVFWLPGQVSERPGRFDDKGDPVGAELARLVTSASDIDRPGMCAYLAMWHRSRAVNFLQLGRRAACLRSIGQSARLGGGWPRLLLIGLFAMLPLPKPGRLFQSIKVLIDRYRANRHLA